MLLFLKLIKNKMIPIHKNITCYKGKKTDNMDSKLSQREYPFLLEAKR